jgi:peptidoglycan/xylan/chitin deacetylase (PgdA/CDA1 family)
LHAVVTERSKTGSWPAGCVVLTFDDGYANLLEWAEPVLTKHGFTATVFVVSDYIGRTNAWETPPRGFGSRDLLGWDQLGTLAEAGWEIGGHTRTHPDLCALSVSDAQLEDEIAGSGDAVAERLGRNVTSFAYPYGRFDERAERIVTRVYSAGCTTRLCRATIEPVARLPRVDAYYVQEPRLFEKLIAGRLDRYLMLRRWGRRVRRWVAADRAPASTSAESHLREDEA